MCDDKLMTLGEWENLSAESRHKINVYGIEHSQMKDRIDALEAYLSNVRIGLGNIGCVPDSELGWQVKILKLRIMKLEAKPIVFDAEK
jgi:hypothetical protein